MAMLKINGQTHELDVPDGKPLLWVLRDDLGLTGTKFGCGIAQCGACTVLAGGNAMRSCTLPATIASSLEITTIDGLETPVAQAVQAAWVDLDVPQCGFCQSGQVMSAVALLSKNPKPSDQDIDGAMAGNICRCATYQRIRAAIHQAAQQLEA